MMEIYLDGERIEVPAGTRLGEILPGRDMRCSVAVIRPALGEATAESQEVRFVTSAGDMVVEMADPATVPRLFAPGLAERLRLHWQDRYAAAFGPFETGIRPARAPGRYERGDVILGCGGYDPARSYLIFARMRHTADYGAPADGGVIGRVVTGRGLLDRIAEGDRVVEIKRILRRADRSHAIVTRDPGLPLEDGMQVVSSIEAEVQGFTGGEIDTRAARSVEHFLLSVQSGRFRVDRSSSTHITDTHLVPTKVPPEFIGPRLEGSITVRTAGKSSGATYIYTQGVSASPAHTVVGRVVHGLELVRFSSDGDLLAIRVEPEQFDLVGLTLAEAEAVAERRGIALTADAAGGDRMVVGQTPATTLEVLSAGAARVATEAAENVVSITLDEAAAPRSVTIFREVTGLKHHAVGKMPLVFRFEDVSLFKPKIGKGVGIIPENTPTGEVPAFTLAMTNDSRRGAGMVGIRETPNAEFGPTAEPLTGTNVIGKVLDAGSLAKMREGTTVYVREVK